MRKYFINNIRWMIILFLVPYHAAQAFNTWGELNYVVFEPDKVLSSIIVFLSPFYMPIMFLLAGMSARYSLVKRSYGQFFLERIKRLLIPFVFGTLFFCPVMAYIGDKTNMGYDGGFFGHYKIFFTKWTDLSGFDGGFGVGQFWFLYFLFIISLVGVGITVLINRVIKDKKANGEIPFFVICLLVIPFPFLYDLLSVGGKSFAEYLYVFLLGFYIFSNDSMIEKAEKYRRLTFLIGLIAGILDVYMFIWSGKDYGAINTIAKAFTEWFMILALIGIGKKRFEFHGKISGYLSSRSFLFFSIHFVWVVLFQYWFFDLFGNNKLLLYFVPVAAAYFATFICSEICMRIPVLRFLMGVKGKSKV